LARPKPASALKSLLEGRDLLRKGNIAEALLRADTAIGLAPHGSNLLADGWTLHGDVRLIQGNPQAARAAFERALHVNAAHIEAHLGLAESFRRMSQPGRAIPLYLETLPLLTDESERARVRSLVVESYRAAGQPEAARRAVRAGGMRNMDISDRLRALGTLLLPMTRGGWLLLLAIAALFVLAARQFSAMPALITFALLALIYATLRWWRTPGATKR
jgi:tetratricopeptide (TPR) repeat protein